MNFGAHCLNPPPSEPPSGRLRAVAGAEGEGRGPGHGHRHRQRHGQQDRDRHRHSHGHASGVRFSISLIGTAPRLRTICFSTLATDAPLSARSTTAMACARSPPVSSTARDRLPARARMDGSRAATLGHDGRPAASSSSSSAAIVDRHTASAPAVPRARRSCSSRSICASRTAAEPSRTSLCAKVEWEGWGCRTKAPQEMNAVSSFLLVLVRTKGELAHPVHHTVLETISRDQSSELSSATMIPQMTVVADLTRGGD